MSEKAAAKQRCRITTADQTVVTPEVDTLVVAVDMAVGVATPGTKNKDIPRLRTFQCLIA